MNNMFLSHSALNHYDKKDEDQNEQTDHIDQTNPNNISKFQK